MSSPGPRLLARGPWEPRQVHATWSEDAYEPEPEASAGADAVLDSLRERGSPTHDGMSARMASFEATPEGLSFELEPARWALRLAEGGAQGMSALCVVRDAEGRWLAGRRAAWLASWPGRWALGAGGAVDVGESPAHTLSRELMEEWSVRAERLTVEALVRLPSGLVLLVGLAWLEPGAELTIDPEHDACAWWPADVGRWPDEADEPLRRMAALLTGSG